MTTEGTEEMSMNQITSYSAFDSGNVKRNDYANSLAAEALRAGIFTENDMDDLRSELLKALAEVIGYYTKNESSSIKADTARKLSLSMIYNIDTYLLSLGDDMTALTTLKERPAGELYGKGYLINQKYCDDAKHLYVQARYTRIKNAGDDYNRMMDKYFRYYLSTYSAKFGAHEKIYLSLPKLGIVGAFHIDESVDVLKKVLEINAGRRSDVIVSAADTGADGTEEK